MGNFYEQDNSLTNLVACRFPTQQAELSTIGPTTPFQENWHQDCSIPFTQEEFRSNRKLNDGVDAKLCSGRTVNYHQTRSETGGPRDTESPIQLLVILCAQLRDKSPLCRLSGGRTPLYISHKSYSQPPSLQTLASHAQIADLVTCNVTRTDPLLEFSSCNSSGSCICLTFHASALCPHTDCQFSKLRVGIISERGKAPFYVFRRKILPDPSSNERSHFPSTWLMSPSRHSF